MKMSLLYNPDRWLEDRAIRHGGDGLFLIKSGWLDTRVYRVDEPMKLRYVRWCRLFYVALYLSGLAGFVPLIPLAPNGLFLGFGMMLAAALSSAALGFTLRHQLRRFPTMQLRDFHRAPRLHPLVFEGTDE